jgi:hypothetical protein
MLSFNQKVFVRAVDKFRDTCQKVEDERQGRRKDPRVTQESFSYPWVVAVCKALGGQTARKRKDCPILMLVSLLSFNQKVFVRAVDKEKEDEGCLFLGGKRKE